MAPGLRLTYWNPRLLRAMFLQLQQQQQAGLFCDVTLQGDGEGLHVHSCVIAACSPYLAKLLTHPGEMSTVVDPSKPVLFNRRVLGIHEISSHYLLPLVRYMYTSELEVAPADVHGVLKAAKRLRIPELEMLKLEGGRLVRLESGRKLNRDCLSSKKHTPYTVFDVQNSGLRFQEMHTKNNEPKSLGAIKNEPSSPDMVKNEPSSPDIVKIEPRYQSAQVVVEPSCKSELEVGLNCPQESMMEKGPFSQYLAEEPNSSSSISYYCNKSGEKSGKQNIGSSKILPDQEGELLAGEKQARYDIKSRKGLLKRICLDRAKIQTIPPDIKTSKTKSRRMGSRNINISISNDPELYLQSDMAHLPHDHVHNDLQFVEELRGHHLPDETTSEEHAEYLGGLVDCGLRSKKIKTLHLKDGTDKGQYTGCEMTNPSVHSATESYSTACIGLEGVKEAWSALMTEVQNETVTQKSLASVTHCKSDTGMVCLQDKNMNESGKRQLGINKSHVNEVQKVKLRKVSTGLSWEVVREVDPPHIECYDGKDNQLNEFEQLLEQILNMPSPMSPVVDVGGCSPVTFMGESVLPDLSSDSDIEVDVLG
ncbi:BTB/POZ domain-containing protein 18 [Mixophyes fleayi]|uniref:BTB/POZ domain-containing protein 18 n=1 Tax=Mixophyes fleayi TaxID=3061075 RepID=UPI003F4E2997